MKDTYSRGKVKYLRWTDGRQGSGYRILYVWNCLFDLVFIRYPQGSYINWHTDPVPNHLKHYRLNITLRKAEGGQFFCRHLKGQIFWKKGRFCLFRPDIQPHRVDKITSGERWILSIGWTRRKGWLDRAVDEINQ